MGNDHPPSPISDFSGQPFAGHATIARMSETLPGRIWRYRYFWLIFLVVVLASVMEDTVFSSLPTAHVSGTVSDTAAQQATR